MFKGNGGTALVTGGTSGIGLELCRILARNSFNLVIVATNNERLLQAAAEIQVSSPATVTLIEKNLTTPSAPVEICAELEQKGIHIDILVNNAGFQEYGPFSETDLGKELQMIQLHVAALTHLTKLLLPEMLKRGHGKILNVGSTGSFTPGGPLNAVYCATKAYVLSFSEAIAEELKGTGVTVTTLCPGATSTEFARRGKIEDIRLFKFRCGVMDARKVAEIGYQALIKGERSIVTGIANRLTIFSLRYMPRKLMTKTAKYLMSRG